MYVLCAEDQTDAASPASLAEMAAASEVDRLTVAQRLEWRERLEAGAPALQQSILVSAVDGPAVRRSFVLLAAAAAAGDSQA